MRRLFGRAVLPILGVLTATAGSAAEDASFCAQGYSALNRGANELAVDLYSRCIKLGKLGDRMLSTAYSSRGEAQRRDGYLGPAQRDFTTAIDIDPGNATAFRGRAMVVASVGNHARAIDDYDRALRLEPVNASLYYNRALSYIGNGQHDFALHDLDKVLRLNPNFVGAVQYNRGIALCRLRRYTDATDAFDRAIMRRWNLANVYLDRGILFLHQKKYQEAFADFTSALVLLPGYGDALAYRALTREWLNARHAAHSDYRKAMEHSTRLAWVAERLALLDSDF